MPAKNSYSKEDLDLIQSLSPKTWKTPDQIGHSLQLFAYQDDWQIHYRVQSVHSTLHSEKITCLDAAILTYGLLELFFPQVKRRLLVIHRRSPDGRECGHCVTLFWGEDGKVGAFSKSSLIGFENRPAIFLGEMDIANSFAKSYLKLGMQPLYFGTTTLEEVASDLDWRNSKDDIRPISERLLGHYQYAFELTKK